MNSNFGFLIMIATAVIGTGLVGLFEYLKNKKDNNRIDKGPNPND